jgi:hypothetical protein
VPINVCCHPMVETLSSARHLPAHREVTIHLRLRPRILVSTMYEPTTFTRNQMEVVGVNRNSPKTGSSYLVFRCCKQVISFRMKQRDAGTRPKARPGRTIASFGSTWQVGGKAYCAPTMKTRRISKGCAPSAHSERSGSFARSPRSLPVFSIRRGFVVARCQCRARPAVALLATRARARIGERTARRERGEIKREGFRIIAYARVAGSARHLLVSPPRRRHGTAILKCDRTVPNLSQ